MTEARLPLYPEIASHRSGRLRVSPVHELYFEECGNPRGAPVVVLHGGPGGGCNPSMRRYHDPASYRIVLFDQRGCGRSTPHASLEDNTTWALVEDIEKLRAHLGVERWQVFGGSWGSTLALAYAQTYPDRVSGLILRGIFLLRRRELEWFYQEGCSWIYPDAFQDYLAPIPAEERHDMIAAYYRRLTGKDESVRRDAARAWSVWEGRTLSLLPDPVRVSRFADPHYALALARIEAHYFVHGGFLSADDQLLTGAARMAHISGVIVHGRYDVVTPLANAWELSRVWPKGELRIVPDSGHAMSEPGIVHELVSATRSFAVAG